MDIAKALTLRGPASHVYVALRVYELDFEGTLTAKFVHHVDPRKMVYDEDIAITESELFQFDTI